MENKIHSEKSKITELEASIANIRPSPQRQERLVISGDRNWERYFYTVLEERGQINYRYGIPSINLTNDKCIKILKKLAKKFDGVSAIHALNLQLEREGVGIFGGIKAAIANHIINHRNVINVVIIGDQNTINEKLKELGYFLRDLERKGYIPMGVIPRGDDNLTLGNKKPLSIKSSAKLHQVVSFLNYKISGAQNSPRHSVNSNDATTAAAGNSASSPDAGDGWTSTPTNGYMQEDNYGPTINPASGLPMVGGAHVDIRGDVWGQNTHDA